MDRQEFQELDEQDLIREGEFNLVSSSGVGKGWGCRTTSEAGEGVVLTSYHSQDEISRVGPHLTPPLLLTGSSLSHGSWPHSLPSLFLNISELQIFLILETKQVRFFEVRLSSSF